MIWGRGVLMGFGGTVGICVGVRGVEGVVCSCWREKRRMMGDGL